jgi:putative oxidoreductase
MKAQNILFHVVRITAAVIMLQTLFFKFSASAESVYIFSTIGMEPWGRIGVGVAELMAAGLLLVKRWSWVGALLGIGLMVGAVGMHLTILGIEVLGDGGYLFTLATIVLICSVLVMYLQAARIREFVQRLPAWFTA